MGNKGFTLVEIMVAMAISGIVMASVYIAFLSQQNSYLAQEQVAEMQQNIRAGVNIMVREIRMAGFDPSGTKNYNVLAASNNSFSFTADINMDGGAPGAGETFLYELYDTGADGINDALRRTPGANTVAFAVAENIEQLEFSYTLEDGTQTTAPTASQLSEIRNVQISILARAGKPDQNFLNTATYTTASGAVWNPTPDDNFRRRLLTTTVQCRNMGL